MWFLDVIILALGLGALTKGADLLVQQSTLLAKHFQWSPFLVGVVLLGMGTSAPEGAVSVLSSIKGLSHLAVGNVIGSNIFNLMLVLGMLLLKPLPKVKIQTIRKDILFLIFTGLALIPLMWDLALSRLDALILTAFFVIYLAIHLGHTLASPGIHQLEKSKTPFSGRKATGFILLGFLLLVGGSQATVIGAKGLGLSLGISERILGLLLVSVGTSLPEFVTSLVALVRGQKDMAVGNIMGSNVFNSFFVLSLALWIRPTPLDTKMLLLDLPALMWAHALLLPLLFGYHIKWVQKGLPFMFMGSYIVFLLFVLIN